MRASGVPIAHEPVHRQGNRDAAHEGRIADVDPEVHGGPEVVDLGGHRLDRELLRLARSDVGVGPFREVSVPTGVGFSDLDGILMRRQSLGGELLDRAEQPETRLVLGPTLQHVLVEEPLEHVGVRPRDGLRCRNAGAAGEDGQAIEDGPLVIRQQVVAPGDRRAQGGLTRVRITPALQQVQPRRQPLEELFDREELQPRGGELQREGKPVEPLAHGLHVGARPDRDAARRGSGDEELHRVVGIHRGNRELLFRRDLHPFPARDEEGRTGRLRKELRDVGRDPREEMLGVVEHDEVSLPAEPSRQRLREWGLRLLGDLQGERDPGEGEVTVRERRERHPPDPVGEGLGRFGGGLEGEARLPGPTGTGEGEERDVFLPERCGDRVHLVIAADERCGRHGEVRAVERPDRWEVSLAQLVDPLRGLQVLESMIAEIDQREPLGVDLLHRR